MEKQINYVKNYLDAYKSLKKAAVEAIKNYGNVIDIKEKCKLILMEQQGYKREDEIPDDELCDFVQYNTYSCALFVGDVTLYSANVVKVRYDGKAKEVEVYLESDEGYVDDWYPVSWVNYGEESVYFTILEFLETSEKSAKSFEFDETAYDGNGKEIHKGNIVIWTDPETGSKVKYNVYEEPSSEMVKLSNEHGECEALPGECLVVG